MVFYLIKFFLTFILLFSVMWLSCDTLYHYLHIPHYRNHFKPLKPSSFLWHFFNTIPLLIAQDIEEKFSSEFKEHGVMLFTGKQGSGKTMAMTYYINRLIMKYPDLKVGTNYGLMCQDCVKE